MNEKDLPADIVAQFDQVDTNLTNIARLLGTYYHELLDAGIPQELASTLVVRLQRYIVKG